MTIAIYLRVSTEEQVREGISLAVQEERCRARALQDACKEVRVYRDDGYSGTSLDRPALQELLRDLESLDVIYTWRLDRLSRSVRDMANLTATLAEAHVGLVSVTEAFDFSSPMGRAMLGMLSVFAELFVDILRENVRAALRHRAQQGLSKGRPPYGYDYPRDAEGRVVPKSILAPVPDEAAVVRRVYRSYARGGSMLEIARGLTADGVRGKAGATVWDGRRVSYMLRNPTYLGQVRYGEELYEGEHEALVGSALWQSVQRRLARRAAVHPRSRDASLSPLLTCGVCGGNIILMVGREWPHYSCGARRRLPREARHEAMNASAAAVEAIIWAWTRRLFTEDIIEQAIRVGAAEERTNGAAVRRRAMRDRLAEVERLLTYNLEAARRGAIDLSILTAENEPLLADRDRLREELAQAEARDLPQPWLRWLAESTENTIARIEASGDYGRQREFLERVYSHIEIHSRQVVFHHRLAIPAKTVELPRYYSPGRGVGEIVLE